MAAHKQALERAAIAVLAELGGRGLTHRAVDRRAGLPEGTTSRYARTRGALLGLAAAALVGADRDAMTALGPWPASATLEMVVDRLVAATRALLRAPQRYRARVELQLEAARDPGLRAHFDEMRAAFVGGLSKALSRSGLSSSRRRADALVTCIDGVLHRQIILAQPALPHAQLRALLGAVVQAPPA